MLAWKLRLPKLEGCMVVQHTSISQLWNTLLLELFPEPGKMLCFLKIIELLKLIVIFKLIGAPLVVLLLLGQAHL
jgi:hypothetical protein